ncbi:MAG: sigma-70 family RNA polymerase sigma factor [Bacteroidales bacterium]|nr:sigma-70 family RNA polymerase sigma factor [Bacteroidales bacterium]
MRAGLSELEDCFKRYSWDLYSYGLCLCRQTDIVDDAIHDVFVDIHANAAAFSRAYDKKRYLMASVRNKIYHRLNDRRVNQNVDISDIDIESPGQADDDIIGRETMLMDVEIVKEMVSSLNIRQREILYLRFNEGKSFKEISRIMRVQPQSAQNLFQRTLAKLKRLLVEGKIAVEK